MKKTLYLFFLLACWSVGELSAQVKNNDCVNVFLANRLVCGNATFTQDNLNGKGLDDFSNDANFSGCLTGKEHFSAWYAFKVQNSGKLTLDIIPLGADDYDFAIYGPNKPCNNLGTPIRCSYASPKAPNWYKTGMSLDFGPSSTYYSENAGGAGYVRYLDVVEGELYYLLIDNFSNNSNGFQLIWGGEAAKLANSTAEFTPQVSCNVANFNNTSAACDGTLGYEWDFGDGSPITSENFKKSPTHHYQAIGTYQVKLTTTIITSSSDENLGALATQTKPVTITKVPPVINMPTLKDKYCITESVVTLTATPTGGKFAIKKNQVGEFVDNQTSFNPAALGVGKHEVKYSYQDPTDISCQSVKIKVVTVYALPTLDLNSLQSNYCEAAPAFPLVGNPTGGVFKINNVVATSFNPTALGAGTYTVSYDYTDATSECSNTTTKEVIVHPTPTLAFSNVRDAYCLAGSPFVMQATPAGGTFKINGVTATSFDIATLGIGTHTVEYSYTSPAGCSKTISKPVQIADKPAITFVGLDAQYCTDITAFNLQATPAGGTFKVNGATATQFNPSALTSGSYTIEYSYVDPSDATCFNSDTKVVQVKKAPVLVWSGVLDKYCVSENINVAPQISITYNDGSTETASPATLAFNPATKGVSTFTLSHTVTDATTGCVSTITKEVAINALPTLAFVDLADSYCQQSFDIVLKATPINGTFTVDGVTSTILKPRDFAVGDKPVVRYDYTDANGCSNSITKQVEITPANAFVPVEEEVDICPQPQYWLEALTMTEEDAFKASGVTPVYYWKHTTASLRAIAIRDKSEAGEYEVTVRDQAGCPIAQKTFMVSVDCEPKLFIPTAFTPNADGKNEMLKIFGEDFIKLDFRVYNRWGEVVFTARSREEAWDGMIKGQPAPAGIYAWSATFENTLKRGEVVRKQGQFMLIR